MSQFRMPDHKKLGCQCNLRYYGFSGAFLPTPEHFAIILILSRWLDSRNPLWLERGIFEDWL